MQVEKRDANPPLHFSRLVTFEAYAAEVNNILTVTTAYFKTMFAFSAGKTDFMAP
jgi:hypothetical protein